MTIYHKHHIIPKHMGGTNDPSNLVTVTIEEHANLHKQLWEELGHWQDKVAWLALSGNYNTTPEIQSEIGRNIANARVNTGTHPWLDKQKQSARAKQRILNGTHNFLNSEFQKEMNKRAFADGKHPWLDKEKQRQKAIKRTEEGNNPFSGEKINRKMLENGIHPSQNLVECEKCGKIMSYANYKRWKHGNECKK